MHQLNHSFVHFNQLQDPDLLTVGQALVIPDRETFHMVRRGETLYLAAGKGIGIPDILSLIDSALEEDRVECRFLVPYSKGGVLQEMRRFGVLLSEKYLPEGTEVRVRCRRGDARRFQTMLKT